MGNADVTRWTSSGGVFGFYDRIPPGELEFGAVSFPSGLRNTIVVTKNLAAGSSVDLLYSQNYNFFSARLAFSGSVSAFGVDLGTLTIRSNAVTVTIGTEQFIYNAGNLAELQGDLEDNFVPGPIAADLADAVADAFGAISTVEEGMRQFVEALDSTDYAALAGGVDVQLTSNSATAFANGTSVDIGNIVDVAGTSSDDVLAGGSESNVLQGRGGSDRLIGGGGSDRLEGGSGSDFYEAGNGDTISDSDGSGQVRLDGTLLVGGKLQEEEEACEPGNDGESDEEKVWIDENTGTTYRLSGSTLTVSSGGSSITITGFSNGDLGINLEDEAPEDGDDCDGPPDEYGSPLVLDLDGDGIELTALAASGVFFDIDGDGIAERTGWVAPDDGLLVVDRDGDQKITSAAELFGYGSTYSGGYTGNVFGDLPGTSPLLDSTGLDISFDSGFTRLEEFDQNLDGVIDASDFRFNELQVWRDLNGDGVSQSNELSSLTDSGVAAINLTATSVSEENAGNLITDRGTFTTTSGQEQAIVDAWFLFSQYDNRAINPVDISDDVAALPNLNGAGTVLSLREEMALNPELRDAVAGFAANPRADLSSLSDDVAKIIYNWTNVSDESTYFRGSYADARAVAVMEAFTDTAFRQWSGPSPRPFAGGAISDQFDAVLQFATARLTLQTDWGQALFPEMAFEAGINIVLDSGTTASTMIDRLTATLPDDPAAKLAHLQAGFRILDLVRLSFDESDGVSFDQATEAAIATAGLDLTYQQILTARVGGDGNDQFLLQSVTGNQYIYDDTRVVSGGAGDDFIKIGGEQAIVYWGDGQGNDSLTLDPIWSQGWGFSPQIELRISGVDADGLTFAQSQEGYRSGVIRIDATGEELLLRNLLNERGDLSGAIVLDDGTTLTFRDVFDVISQEAATGSDDDDTLLQSGNVGTLDGGAGDDLLTGSAAATDYVFDVGYGHDVIADSGTGNRVLFGAGITQTNLQSKLIGYNFDTLVIEVTDVDGNVTDSLTIQRQQRDDGLVVDSFVLFDGTVLTETEILGDFGSDGPGDDIVVGTQGSDFLGMNAGNDTVYGRDGGDFYEWQIGDGNDTIIDSGQGEDILFLAADFADFDITDLGRGSFAFEHTASGETVTAQRGIDSYGFNDLFDLDPISLAELVALGGNEDLTPLGGTQDADTLVGTEGGDEIAALAGDDIVTALGGNDVIVAGLGNDSVDAGAGNDVVSAGSGDDDIVAGEGDDSVDAGSGMDVVFGGTGNDRIDVGDRNGVSQADRRGNEAYGGEGDDVIVGGWDDDILEGGAGNDTINGDFGDDTFRGGAGDDLIFDRDDNSTYLYDLGDGNDLIFNANGSSDYDVLEFGANINLEDVTWSFEYVDGRPELDYYEFDSGDWGLRGDIAGGGSVTMRGGFNDRIGGLNEVVYGNGETQTIANIGAATRAATDADQLIVGVSRTSNDALGGGAGNDTIVGNFGNQTFIFGTGDGDDILIDPYLEPENLNSAGFRTTTIQLGTGLTAEDIAITRGGDADRDIILTLPSGETLTIRSQYDTQQDRFVGNGDGLNDHDWIDQITFLDGGPGLDAAALRAAALTATDGDDIQIGTGRDDVMVASAGTDILRGGLGSDTYTFGIGDGADRIEETSDNVKFSPDEFEFEGGTFDLSTLRETDTLTFGAGITVDNITLTATGTTLSDIRVTLDGNTDDVLVLADQLAPDANWGRATKLGGFGGPVDVFRVAARVEGDAPIGLDGPFGPDGPFDPDGFDLGPDGEVSQQVWENNWGNQYGDDPLFQAGIERFIFADGTELNREEFAALVGARDDAGDNTISTGATGGTLDGGAGFDTLEGGTGDDTYIFSEGMDQDLARDAGGNDAVAFGSGIEILEIAFTRVGENGEDLLIELGGTERNAMLIEGQFAGDGRGIEVFRFADGTEITAETIRETLLARSQTPGNDAILGFEESDVIFGLSGDDVITPLGGSDIVDGGEGRDTLQLRGPRDDYEITQDGDWTLISDTTGRDGEIRMRNVEVIAFTDTETGETDIETLVPNVGPIAGDISFDGREDVALQLSAQAMLAQSNDPDSETVSLSAVGNASGGAVSIDDAGRVIFTPDADQNGVVGFDYTIVDGEGAQATARATITLSPVNDPVQAVADTIDAVEDTTLVISAAMLTGNDIDIDGDALTITDVSAFDFDVMLNGDGDVVLTPGDNQFGEFSFAYTVSDGATFAQGQVTVDIEEVNDAPVIGGLALSTREDVVLPIAAGIILAAASDVDGDILTIQTVGNATGGSVEMSDGIVTFTPDANFNGDAGFDVTINDGRGGTATTRAVVAVTPVPDDPILAAALADIEVAEDTAITFAIPAGSFTDADGTVPTLTATLADGSVLPAWLSFDGNAFAGQPPQDFNGDLEIEVTASDATGGSATDAFVLRITPVNDAPIVVGDIADQELAEGDALSLAIPGDVFADVDGDALSRVVTLANGDDLPAWLSFDGSTLSGIAPDGSPGVLDLRVTASDGQLDASLDFAVTVTSVNVAPVAVDDTIADVVEGTTYTFAAGDLLANDSDPDGDALSVTSVTQTGNGQVTLNGNGTISYVAAQDSAGADSFSYTISDGELSASATVSLTVTEDDTPTDPYEGWYIGTNRGEFISSYFAGNANVFGAGGRDTIWGSWGDNKLAGGGGNDRLFGSFGDDMLFGNEGRDDLFGGSGSDMLEGGSGRDNLYGGWSNDVLNGGSGRDYLSGGSGNDTLNGGTGRDNLNGGWGSDTFVFEEGGGRDSVWDFRSNDTIAIDNVDFDTFADVQSAMSSNWRGTTINLGDGDRVFLSGVQSYQLDADDFLFL